MFASLVRNLTLIAALILAAGSTAAQPAKPAGDAAKAPPAAKKPPAAAPLQSVSLPPLTAVAELKKAQPALIQGVVLNPQANVFTLNDGNASVFVSVGRSWQDITGVKRGDRVQVAGQIDPFGTGFFKAGSLVTANGRIIALPQP